MNIYKLQYIFPFVIFCFILFLGNSANPPDGKTGAPYDGLCSECHSGGNFDGTVSISGLPPSISPNTMYSITITATATMGSPSTGGFQLVASNACEQNAGDLMSVNAETGTSFSNGREYIDHRGDKAYTGNSVSWNFNWLSPSGPTGAVITMYFASNLTNNNNNSSGDNIINSSQSGVMAGGPPLSVVISSKKNVSCFGGDNGEATATASGGLAPITYEWSNGSMTNKAIMLTAGTYTVTATDCSGTSATASAVITQPTALIHDFKVVKNVTCPGGKDGSILATASGGTAPYNIIYSSGSPNNLKAGDYSVTVTDANSCMVSSMITVTQPDSFSITTLIFENPSCPFEKDGQIALGVTGATPPYKYLWSSSERTNQISGKGIGVYKVTITDFNNCITNRGYELISEDKMAPNLSVKNSIAYLNNFGKAVPKISDYIIINDDNCDPSPELSINIDTFRCTQVGKHNFIITSTDDTGNQSKDTLEIDIRDTLKPAIHVWQDTTFNRCDIKVPYILASDNCPIIEFIKLSGPDTGTIFPIGKTTLSYTAKDVANNTTTDSFITTIISPLHYTIDSSYFNLCLGDTAFTVLSIKHDLDLPIHFYILKDTIKILMDTTFIIKSSGIDTINFRIDEVSSCLSEYKKEVKYPGAALKLDSFKIKDASDVNDGVIEIFINGADSISWYDASTNSYINNTGINLFAGDYIVKAYKGNCEFIYGPYKVKQILSSADLDKLNVTIFPMPFTNEFSVVTNYNEPLRFVLLNAQGHIISQGQFMSNLEINGSILSNGVYFLRCYSKNNSISVRLIKI